MAKMERTLIKNSFVGFAHRVAPLQNVFHKHCDDADLNIDVLEFLSFLQKEMVGKMMDGACAISQHRKSKDVVAEDLLCHLDTQWNLDPLLMTANCIKTCYRVTETTEKIDLSFLPESLPRKRRTKRSSNLPKLHPASSKAKKNSAGKSKLKSKCDQSIKITNNKSKANSKSQDKCREKPLKHPMPLLSKKPDSKLKAKKQLSKYMPDLLFEVLGYKYKWDVCNFDSVSKPSAVLPKSKSEEKISICESSIKVPTCKGKSEIEFPVQISLDPKADSFKIAGSRHDVSVADDVPKLSKAPMCKLKSKVEKQSLASECSIKVLPFKEKTKPKFKVPTSFGFESESHTYKIAGLRQDTSVADAISKPSPEAPIFQPKSKVEKKILTCESSSKLFPFKEKTEPKSIVPTRINYDSEILTLKTTETKEKFSKQSPEACVHKPKSNVKKMLTHKQSKEVTSLRKETEPEFKFAKQSSIEVSCPDSQALKMPGRKSKQEVSSVKYMCASVESLEEAKHSDSCARKISLKRRKREVFDMNDVPVETPKEARKRLAIILLRIAGRY